MPTEKSIQALARELNISKKVLKTFQGISDPKNAHLFSAEAARKAFAHVSLKNEEDKSTSVKIKEHE